MKAMKKFLSLVLALMLVLSSVAVLADELETENEVTVLTVESEPEDVHAALADGSEPGIEAQDEGNDEENGSSDGEPSEVSKDHYPHVPEDPNGVVEIEPTCTQPGKLKFYCTECKENYFQEIPALGHKPVGEPTGESVTATCTSEGLLVYASCERCDAKNIEVVTPKLDHQYDPEKEVIVEATCLEPETHTNVCVECGFEKVWTKGEKLGHQFEVQKIDPVFPTCTSEGQSGLFEVCVRCGAKNATNDSKFIDPLDHAAELEQYFVYAKKDDVEDPDNYAVDKDGYILKDGKKVCIGSTLTAGTHKIEAANGYCEVEYTYTLPTCTTAGVVTVKTTECEYSKTETIAPLGHSFDDGVWQGETAPNCTIPGKVLYTCQTCGYQYQADVVARGHHVFDDEIESNVYYLQKKADDNTEQVYAFKDIATCHDYKKVIRCDRYPLCDEVKVIEVAGSEKHKPDPAYHVIQNPTCTADGYEFYYCSECGYAYRNDIPAIDHTLEATVTKQPTCEAEGERTYTCTVCKQVIRTERIPATGHKYKVVDKESKAFTCTEDGVRVEKCAYCGDVKKTVLPAHHVYDVDEKGNPTGKIWGYTAPTCTKAGKVSYYCSVCHTGVNGEEIPALGHTRDREGYEAEYTFEGKLYQTHSEATCIALANYTYKCEVCGYVDKNEYGEFAPHALFDRSAQDSNKGFVITKLPTCESEGEAHYNCSVCKNDVTMPLSKLPHNYVTVWDAKNHTYTSVCQTLAVKDMTTAQRTAIDEIAPTLLAKVTVHEDGDVLGIGCNETTELSVKKTHYSIEKNGNTISIKIDDGAIELPDPVLYVVWSYTLADGTSFSYTKTFEMGRNGDYRIGNPSTPDGATLNYVLAIVCDDLDLENSGAGVANANGFGYQKF